MQVTTQNLLQRSSCILMLLATGAILFGGAYIHTYIPSFTTFIILELTYARDIVIMFSDHLFLLTQIYSQVIFLEKGEMSQSILQQED
jgi:hypothetical protein